MVWLAIPAAASPQVQLAQVQEPMGTFPPDQMNRAQSPYMKRHQQRPSGPSQQQPPQPAPASAPSAPAPAIAPLGSRPPSLLDKPAEPAKVDLAQGQLSIHADNSSLIEIMHRLTADAGMTVDGLNRDQRVFGTYGPGDPQEIISELLDGTGYNVVMVGRTEAGTPKQVTLTPRVATAAGSPGPLRPAESMNQMNQEDDADDEMPQPVVANPVVENPQQTPPQQQPGGGVRTPQQMLQELQQMRQQQLQQQGPPQQPVPPQQQ